MGTKSVGSEIGNLVINEVNLVEAPATSSTDPKGSIEATSGGTVVPRPPPPPPRRTRGTEGTTCVRIPRIPREPVEWQRAPTDLGGREPSASTVFAGNIEFEASEREILEYFNSIGGTFEPREPNVVLAVNFAYRRFTPHFNGKAFFLYSTVELAEYAVRKLNDKPFFGRKLWVLISEQRLNVRTTRGNVLGSSRAGAKIWDCASANGNYERTGNSERAGNSK